MSRGTARPRTNTGSSSPAGGQVLEEVDAHELLRDASSRPGPAAAGARRRAPPRQGSCARPSSRPPAAARRSRSPSARGSSCPRPPGWPGARRAAPRRRSPPAGTPAPAGSRTLALGVEDLAGRGRLEPDEGSEVGKVATVEVDVVDEHAAGRSRSSAADRAATRTERRDHADRSPSAMEAPARRIRDAAATSWPGRRPERRRREPSTGMSPTGAASQERGRRTAQRERVR